MYILASFKSAPSPCLFDLILLAVMLYYVYFTCSLAANVYLMAGSGLVASHVLRPSMCT